MPAPLSAKPCVGVNKDGRSCNTRFGLSEEGYCFSHDPLRAVEFAASRRARSVASGARKQELQGSLPPGMPRAPKTLDDSVRWASWAMHAAASGIIDARLAHEIGVLVTAFRGALEKRDMLKEIAKLRADLAEAKKTAAHPRVS